MDIRNFFGKPPNAKSSNNSAGDVKSSSSEAEAARRKKKRIQVLDDDDDDAKQTTPSTSTPTKKVKTVTPGAFFSSSSGSTPTAQSTSKSSKPKPATSTKKTAVESVEVIDSDDDDVVLESIPTSTEKKAPSNVSPNKRKSPMQPRSPKSKSQPKKKPAVESSKQISAPSVPVQRSTPVQRSEQSGSVYGESNQGLPTGNRLCLTGKAFAVTGVPELCSSRKDLEYLIQEYGGVLKSTVSSRCNFLVAAGTLLEDGREIAESRKYKTAQERSIPILSESDLFEMIRTLPTPKGVVPPPTKPMAPPTSSSNNRATASANNKGKGKLSSKPSDESCVLWADKYKPKGPEDVIGNPGAIRQLQVWLRDWESVHVKKTKKVPFNKSNPGAKAALISGPPGIGKSSSVAAIGKSMGYDIFELNASDARSKKLVQEQLSSVVGSTDLNFGHNKYGKSPKRLIIMDEVDGMSSQDRGGMQELIKIIKVSKTPIVCICNDRQKSSVRSLAGHCFDLRFQRPDKNSVTNRMLKIAQMEGMQVEPEALRMAVNNAGADIRQVLNLLQMWKSTSTSMTFSQMKSRSTGTSKDAVLRLSHFDACHFIFCGGYRKGNFNAAFDAYFTDIDMMPLMISEQYVVAAKRGNQPGMAGDLEQLERISRAADAVSDMDQVGLKIRSNQMWELLPLQAALGVRVSSICQGGIARAQFPEWLGKNSTRTKRHRLVSELAMHLRQKASCSRVSIATDYVPAFRTVVLDHMDDSAPPDARSKLIDFMDSYGLSRDDVFETLPELQYSSFPNKFEQIPSKVKAQFTREYNKRAHTSQALVHEDPVKKLGGGKRKKKKANDLSLIDEGGENEDAEDESDNDSIAELMTAAKATKPGSKGSSSTGKTKKSGKASTKKKLQKPRTNKGFF